MRAVVPRAAAELLAGGGAARAAVRVVAAASPVVVAAASPAAVHLMQVAAPLAVVRAVFPLPVVPAVAVAAEDLRRR